jgi:hypothetical protein
LIKVIEMPNDLSIQELQELVNEPLFNQNDGLSGRDGANGLTLDQLELREAETRRAAAEGRAPDYTNMLGTAGVRLVSARELAESFVPNTTVAVPSRDDTGALQGMIEVNINNPNVGPNPVWTPEVETLVETPVPTDPKAKKA